MSFWKGVKFQLWTIGLVLMFGLLGCVPADISSTPTVTPQLELIPYSSPTPVRVSSPTREIRITPTIAPSPTPTPLTYEIVAGDTMLAIAFQHGITLEELLAANPDVNPRALSVGTELIIPFGAASPSLPVTATPISITTQPVDCYVVSDGVFCLMLVDNDKSRPLENVSAQMVLYDQNDEILVDGIAITALNQIPVDQAIPVTAFFQGNYSEETIVLGKIMTGSRVPKNDDRYLNIWSQIDSVEISDDRSYAIITGTMGIPSKDPAANFVWLLAIAYDDQGKPVGVRKIEQTRPLEPGQSREFEIAVYSLGPEIAEIAVIPEARP